LLSDSKLAAPALAPAAAPSGRPVIQLENVSVCYRLPHERIPSLKEFAIRWLRRQLAYHEFWALKNVSLDVQPGEVYGLIGPNGAGKSTLLKVVARVLRPTTGRVRVRGRVAPLLELGAGFDVELTGRENVFLNGAILGYSRADIAQRFDRIVDFAGVREFVDAPLRTYSSGMTVRLGFAVATDVRPEVLIVDEVLAVGDAEFQRKSTARMEEFRAAGATILMVSHNMVAVEDMCSRAAWLEHGHVLALGVAHDVVRAYQAQSR
jgi:ABC-2 type transport system ATP-binding protein/lipopolysaccharide transport system ATP-binding protein